MPRLLNIAAVRMDAAPSSLESRLKRAQALVARAARQAAQLVVLPELFNTGYEYSSQNYRRAEPPDGETVSWMKDEARRQAIHLAGSLLLREPDGIYNALLLVAPDGCLWRYDKTYPWAWERAYFQPRKNAIRVAETGLGSVGMLICWDVAHPNLWAQFAGRIDLFVSSSCPPLVHRMEIHLPDGKIVNSQALGRLFQSAYQGADNVFGQYYLRQACWLGVPSVNTTGAGRFDSFLPRPVLSAASFFATRPRLWKYILLADKIKISAGYFDGTFIADAGGNVVAKTKLDGDDQAVATVQLAEKTPQPVYRQPRSGLGILPYLLDAYVNAALKKYYNQHWQLKKQGS